MEGASYPHPQEGPLTLEERNLALIKALLPLDKEEDIGDVEAAIAELQENIRARQLVIGYSPSGTPVLKQRFLDRLRHTLHDLNHDEFVTLPDFERRAADW
jgi:hypothetical protein